MQKDLTGAIERLQAMEDRLNVKLSGLSAFVEYDDDESIYLTVQGELHMKDGGSLTDDLEMQVVAYDAAGRVVGTDTDYIDSKSFFGFHVFSILGAPKAVPSRVRVFPKPS